MGRPKVTYVDGDVIVDRLNAILVEFTGNDCLVDIKGGGLVQDVVKKEFASKFWGEVEKRLNDFYWFLKEKKTE